MIAPPLSRSCRALDIRKEKETKWMTAYLISLALAGLVAIAVWDALV
jgi:hypothetical protein